ncbi:titin-like [Maniola jurtina]|uniref:titin-like n=1 Tax=Maniola jurtina TaxID=191418 RepID=UPI001E68C5A5|nr:titin-like [Maniola jurtina]
MCEQSEISYLDGDIVWVKLGSCFWPGEVVGPEKLPPDLLPSFRKPPIAVVKFFQEDSYEYVKNLNSIFKYNCSRKNEFINKGLYMYRTKHGPMEKFPEDVIRAETAVGGDIKILTRDEFQETKKESYAGLFGDPRKTPSSSKKGKGRLPESSKLTTPIRKLKEKTNYKVHILLQGSKTPIQNQPTETVSTPSTSRAGSEPSEIPEKPAEDKTKEMEKPLPSTPVPSTPTMSSTGQYACHACQFTTTRLNVLILHNKTHSVSYIPYTPSPPVKKKPVHKTSKFTSVTSKTPKPRKPRQDKPEKAHKKSQSQKRAAEPEPVPEVKKPKTDEEIKSSLLADWDDGDEESNDESSATVMTRSPEVPVAAESPAVPTPAELPSAQIPGETPTSENKSDVSTAKEKPESSSDSKYEFCEDEDWPVEADIGRKIPRIKNTSKRKSETKSLSIDDDEMAREVAELLNKTTVPELPSAPEPLKVEENFPEPSVVKSPDKQAKKSQDQSPPEKTKKSETPPTKTIFKTKTFFRSRHSRSQDAIGKYVAEQLNAAERMDLAESELNGADLAPRHELTVSPPIEHVKVARLAPKIQLKKMKAEAQLREREKSKEDTILNIYNTKLETTNAPDQTEEKENSVTPLTNEVEQDMVKNDKKHEKNEEKEITDLLKLDNLEKEVEIKNGTYETTIIHKEKESTSQDEQSESELKTNDNSVIEPRLETIDNSVTEPILETIDTSVTAPRLETVDTSVTETRLETIDNSVTEPRLETVDNCVTEPRLETFDNSVIEPRLEMIDNSVTEPRLETFDNSVTEPTLEMIDNSVTEPILQTIDISVTEPRLGTIDNSVTESRLAIIDNAITEPRQETIDNSVTELKLESSNSVIKFKANDLEKSYEPFMNESTASAVDALLSVSREADRVTKVISDDPPEDLFEEDIKDNASVNGFTLTNYQAVDENNDQKMNITGIKCATEQPLVNISVDTKQNENDSLLNELQERNNISDLNNIQDTTSATETETAIEEDVSHTLPPKIGFEEVVISTLPSKSDMISELVSNEINKCYATDNTPSESDLQIAEALINLPTTTLQNKSSINHLENNTLAVSSDDHKVHTNENPFQDITKQNVLEDTRNSITTSLQSDVHPSNNDNINSRFETEQEKSENLSAAKSLVQMSETIDHKIKIPEIDQANNKEILSILKRKEDDINLSSQVITKPHTEVITKVSSEDHKSTNITNECKQNTIVHSSKLLKILEEPRIPKVSPVKKPVTKQVIVPGKEKILNFEVGKPILKPKSQSPKQKIIIRRTVPNKTLLNNITEVATPDKIILSRTSKPTQDGSPMQTYTIQTTPEPPPTGEGNTIIIQQKIRKISKPMSKLQKIKPPLQTSPVTVVAENKKTNKDDAMFDINSMPVVLSDDILTPESIEKMPIVMSDGNVITNSNSPPKLIKTKAIVENEKVALSAVTTKSEIKTLLMNSTNEVSKVTTPNILSKSSKLRGAKPMLVIDKVTGKQKIIMTKPEPPVKEIKQPQTLIQSAPQSSVKPEKFIILPTQSSPRPGKTQKIVIDPQTGKAHVLVGKGAEPPLSVGDNKPVSAKLIPSASDASAPGNTVMIITNAQGAQSRIVLTPEHEKILFPNKQQNVSQLKTVTHRVTSGASSAQKSVVSSPNQTKTQTKIFPKQKSAIITSKGQLIVGGRIATTTQNIAPLPEIRPAPKRILAAEPKRLVQTIQKNSSERLIFLQQKSGAVMQLTAAQFEHLQRTGQIIQKAPQEKLMLQKSITISPNETVVVPPVPKQRARKQPVESPTPPKKVKHEIAIAPAPVALPALTPLSNTIPSPVVNIPSAPSSASATNYSDLDNIEELLPSTAIARQDIRPSQPEIAAAQTPPASLSDGQLLAVPGEHFGGPPGSFYLCVEENGSYTVIDHRPLVLENNQLVPMAEPLPVLAQPERRDILEAALANSDVFHAETPRDDAPDFRDLNANVSVHCRVSETSTTLNQPIMTPVEVPSKADSEPAMPSTLEDGLAVIGVTPLTVPTSLELPITVTDPRIAPKTTDPLSNNNYGAALLPSPNTEMTFATSEQMEVSVVGPISMPLLTEEDAVGKSMPILTDEVTERTISSVESTIGSPSSIDVRESENEDSGQWPRRLLTPSSDTSETSAEIPLQPVMQLSANDLSHNS